MSGSYLDLIVALVEERKMHYEDGASLLAALEGGMGGEDETIGRKRRDGKTEIAVIAMACRFPKAASVEQFWNRLRDGIDCIEIIPESRWSLKEFYVPDGSKPYTSYSKWGGFIDDVDKFDLGFFNLSDQEARIMDPQQRLFLEIAHEAFERAGYPISLLKGTETGVFVGARGGFYQSFRRIKQSRAMTTANMANFIPARVSDFFSLKGPSLAIDTACSSSLVAVHMACQSLLAGECSMALAGGVDLKISPLPYLTLSIAKALSPDGKSYVFDRKANGFVPGEGVGAVLLKPLVNAREDGDIVHGVIKSSELNNDGHTMGMTSPNLEGQKDVLRKVYQSGIDPGTISFLEAHGTGTTIGDPIEIKALREVFTQISEKRGYCALGSVKSNIGHLDTAAGIASLIKVILALQHKKIPPTLHCSEPNPRFNLPDSPFYIGDALQKWEPIDGMRRAGISSFGFGGTNCHLVVEEAPPVAVPGPRRHKYGLFVLSAGSGKALHNLVKRYQDFLPDLNEDCFADLCFSSWTCREAFSHRMAVCASSLHALRTKLSRFVLPEDKGISKPSPPGRMEGNRGSGAPDVFSGIVEKNRGRAVFMFSGQGAQYPRMARQLYETFPVFTKALNDCTDILDPLLEKPLKEYLFRADARELRNTAVPQPLIFAVDYALAKLWISMGIESFCVIGHSVGEYPAACIAGVMSLEDGLKLIFHRGRLIQGLNRKGAMAAVFTNVDAVGEHLQGLSPEERGRLSIAAVNSPENTVISGDKDLLKRIVGDLKRQGVGHLFLSVSHTFHSPLMEPVLEKFRTILETVKFREAAIPIVSNVTGLEVKRMETEYWLRHLTEPVLFMQGVKGLFARKYRIFLEVGPGRTLAGLARQTLPGSAVIVSHLHPGQDELHALHLAGGRLFTGGLKFNPYAAERGYRKIKLPTYPFERRRYWITQDFTHLIGTDMTVKRNGPGEPEINHPLIDGCDEQSEKKAVFYKRLAYDEVLLQDHIIRRTPVLAGVAWIEAVSHGARIFLRRSVTRLKEVFFPTPLYIKAGQVRYCEIIVEKKQENIEFLVRSSVEGKNENREIHARGIVETSLRGKMIKADIADIRSRCTRSLSPEVIYRMYRERLGVKHGPFFLGLREVKWKKDQFLAELMLPDSVSESARFFHYHPGLLDSAMQPMLAAVLDEKDKVFDADSAFIPFYIGEINLYGPVRDRCLAHDRIIKKTPEIVKFETTIADLQGNVLLQIRNASSKRVPYTNLGAHHDDRRSSFISAGNLTGEPDPKGIMTDMVHRICWKETPLPAVEKLPPGRWLVFTDDSLMHRNIQSQFAGAGLKCIRVHADDEFIQIDENNYSLNIHSEEDYGILLDRLRDDLPSLRGIIHLWALNPFEDIALEALEKQQYRWAYSLFFLAQALMQRKIETDMWVVTSFARTLNPREQDIIPAKSTLWGVAQVISREFPKIQCRCIDMNPLGEDFHGREIIWELSGKETAPQVLYCTGSRYTPQMRKVAPEEFESVPSPLKYEGVYVITGGLGGIGLNVARHIAQNTRGRIVLIGRHGLPPSGEWHNYIQNPDKGDTISRRIRAVLEIRGLSSGLMVVQGDVADHRRMKEIFQEVKAGFGSIDGVIHGAGLKEDCLILNKDLASFKRVMAPKVQGTAILDALTAPENLDFFIMFSSLASLEGTVSQIDYAAANAYLDSFAHWRAARREGISITINWGLWGEVGMGTTGKTREHAARLGVNTINTGDGLKALEQAILLGSGQFVITPSSSGKSASSLTQPETIPGEGHDSRFSVEAFLTGLVADQLGVDSLSLEKEETTFLELGMDSEGLVEMVHRLEDHFHIKLYPTVFFEYQTIAELSRYLEDTFGEAVTVATPHKKRAPEKKPEHPSRTTQRNNGTAADKRRKEEALLILSDDGESDESRGECRSMDMAIIGYSCRLPGAGKPEAFWKNLIGQVESVTEIPEERWDNGPYYDPVLGTQGKICCNRGGFLDGLKEFDPLFFNISPLEAMVLDPKQRLFMEAAWETLENAGYCGNRKCKRTGVFVGASYNYYYDNLPPEDRVSSFAALGNGLPLLANRFSFFMNFIGPSILVDTYCSSSLVALHMACQSLLKMECDMALVGGAHLPLTPDHYLTMSRMEALSPEGRCKVFDESADGYVPGEGVVTVLLKPLEQAIRDKDIIHAVIKGSAVNHDGHSNNLTAPDAAAQRSVITDAWKHAGIDPQTISYMEAHGTGTSLGDPVELQGLMGAFRAFTNRMAFCALGSVKSNIGHLEPASGLAGLLKIVLALKNGKIPPTLHFRKPNKYMELFRSPFFVSDRVADWPSGQRIRRAGLSSFGLSGTNAHVIVEEAPEIPEETPTFERPAHLLVLSAKNRNALKELASCYYMHLKDFRDWTPAEVCFTTNTGRAHFIHRHAIMISNRESLLDKLKIISLVTEDQDDMLNSSGIFTGEASRKTKLVFAFGERPGGRFIHEGLYENNAVFKALLDEVNHYTGEVSGKSFWNEMEIARRKPGNPNALQARLTNFGIHYALARTMMHWGVQPDFTYGTGIGKLTAAVISETVSLSDALCLITKLRKSELEEGFKETGIEAAPPDIPLISGEEGMVIQNSAPGPSYWSGKEEKSCNLDEILAKLNYAQATVLDFGTSLRNGGREMNHVPALCGDDDGWKDLMRTLGSLYVGGIGIDWTKFYENVSIRKLSLPTYPFQRKTYWTQSRNRQGEKSEKEEASEEAPDTFFRRKWEPAECPEKSPQNPGNVWLILADSQGIGDCLKNHLSQAHQIPVTVRKGEKFRRAGEHHFILNAKDREDYNRLVKTVMEDVGNIHTVTHLWSCDDRGDVLLDMALLEESLYDGIYSLFFLITSMLSFNARFLPRIFAASTNAIVYPGSEALPAVEKSTLAPFVKSVQIEIGKQCRILDYDTASMAVSRIGQSLFRELMSGDGPLEVSYQNKQRLTASLEPVALGEKSASGLLKNGGVYLITGGSTGIGARISFYLAEKAECRLIITGRTHLPEREKWEEEIKEKGVDDPRSKRIATLKQIEEKGAKVAYYAADVCQRKQVEAVVADIKEKFGSIDGIIHCAGIREDALLENKSFDSMRRVLAPKIKGTLNIDWATRGENLDFFILFSSLSAITGNGGQADYAAANAFMDGFVNRRGRNARGKTLAINWPYWEEGGMKISRAVEKRMEAEGLKPLRTSEALAAFETCLFQDRENNIVVMKRTSKTAGIRAEKKQAKTVGTAADEGSIEQMEKYLRNLLKELLLLEDQEIDTETSFEDFGMDSLTMKKAVTSLERYLERPVEPTSFFEYPNITSLAAYLCDVHGSGESLQSGRSMATQREIPEEWGTAPVKEKTNEDYGVAEFMQSIEEINLPGTDKPSARHGDQQEAPPERDQTDIAVIGFSFRFPGARTGEEFWNNLRRGVSSIQEVPKNRWDADRIYSSDPAEENRTYCRWGGFIDDMDKFAASFFGIPEDEAAVLDPQQRLALEIAWETFEHAGYSKRKMWGSNTGIFFGARWDRYVGHKSDSSVIRGYLTGQLTNFISARISDFFNLRGPSLVYDTACSSSLVSIHYACRSIRSGECDMALAGGSELKIKPFSFISLSTAEALSKESKSRVFDRKADGFVPGEGVGVVLLKPLGKALEDGDMIFAVIRGSAVNNDGNTMGITTPNLEAQKSVIEQAFRNAGVDPETIGYVEAHGTGTMIGDPIEVKALSGVFERYTDRRNYCAVGSVKSNIGHLDTAAGIAGFIKVVLSLHHGEIPPTLHCDEPNPRFNFIDSPFYPNTRLSRWEGEGGVRRAGISSFGFGGTNCHMVLEEAPAVGGAICGRDRGVYLLVLSAKTPSALHRLSESYVAFFRGNPGTRVQDVCFTAGVGRDSFAYRKAYVGRSLSEFSEKLSGDTDSPVRDVGSEEAGVVFMFPGQGALYGGMCAELYETEEVFRRSLDRCERILSAWSDIPLVDYVLSRGEHSSELGETAVTQPLTFAVNYSLAQMWMEWGVRPTAVIGHSVGEYVAACVAGVFSLEEGLMLVHRRGRLMQDMCSRGSMAVVFAEESRVEGCMGTLGEPERGRVSIGAVNGSGNVVVSGEDGAVGVLMEKLRDEGIRSHRLSVSHAFHSFMMEPMLSAYGKVLDGIRFERNRIPLISNVTGEMMEEEELGADYWLGHVMKPVLFGAGVACGISEGLDIYLEVGPGTTLCSMAVKIAGGGDVLIRSTLQRGRRDWESVLESVGCLYVRGVGIDFEGLERGFDHCRIALPTYPFERKVYWSSQEVEGPEGGSGSGDTGEGFSSPVLGRCVGFSMECVEYEREFALSGEPLLEDHLVMGIPTLAGVCQWEMVYAGGCHALKVDCISLREVVQKSPLQVVAGLKVCVRLLLERVGGGLLFRIESREAGGDGVWREHCSGKLGGVDGSSPAGRNVVEIRQGLSAHVIGGDTFYERFESTGLSYGKIFRSVREVYFDKGEALARLEVSGEGEDISGWGVHHPGLFDGALQAVIAVAGRGRGGDGRTFVPFFTEEVIFYGSLSGSCYSHVEVLEDEGGEVIKCNVEILDGDGAVCVMVRGFCLKSVPGERSEGVVAGLEASVGEEDEGTEDVIEGWLYEPGWEEKVLASSGEGSLKGGVVVFMNRERRHERLAKHLENSNHEVIRIYAGQDYGSTDNSWTINPTASEQYENLVRRIFNGREISDLLHLWTFTKKEDLTTSWTSMETGLNKGVYSLYFLTRALAKANVRKTINIRLITSYSQQVNGENAYLAPEKAPLLGLAKVIPLEIGRLKCFVYDVDHTSCDGWMEMLYREMAFCHKESILAYRNNKRWIPVLVKRSPAPALASWKFLKTGGVYLVVGGTRGIGLEVARYLAMRYRAKLILVGRSSPLAKSKWKSHLKNGRDSDTVKFIRAVQEMESSGAEVVAEKADVTSTTQMQKCLQKIKRRGWRLDGIFHLAGILRDSLLVRKDFSAFQSVMKPKVKGAWVIARTFAGENPAFIQFFSSLAAVTGNRGQSDYTAANSFLDCYAAYLRMKGLPTQSINWPMWLETGMGHAGGNLKSLADKGMRGISNVEGIAVLEKAFDHMDASRLVIMNDPKFVSLLKKYIRENIPGPRDGRDTTKPGISAGRREKDGFALVRSYLKEAIGAFLDVRPLNIDHLETFLNIGLDSVNLVEMARKLEIAFDIKLYPTIFFEHKTINALSRHLIKEFGDKITAKRSSVSASDRDHMRPRKPSYSSDFDSSKRGTGTGFEDKERPKIIDMTDDRDQRIDTGGKSRPEMDMREAKISEKDIAVIGMAGRFPWADNLVEFWEVLKNGYNAVEEISMDRRDIWAHYSPNPDDENKTYLNRSGFIRNIDAFDAGFFNISPKEARDMDPQQRLFMEVCYHAMENAGYGGKKLYNSNTGLFVGVSYTQYRDLLGKISPFTGLGNSRAIVANRVSYFMNFRGPSLVVDTLCSSSLVSVHLACKSLLLGECEYALAGGAFAVLNPAYYIGGSRLKAFSSDGKCRTFDSNANGYVPGEGVAVVLLRPLRKAIEGRDCIHAVIKGSAINHDGHSSNLTAPNPRAQEKLILAALEDAQVNPRTISYLESHGTGTSLGDPVEIQGLTMAYKRYNAPKAFCAIGSVKSNIGHLEPAAGIAGLIKVILAMKHRQLPPTIHFNKVNPYLDILNSPFYINERLTPWECNGPLQAGISSFGMGGSNAHAILEGPPPIIRSSRLNERTHLVLPLSARSKPLLDEMASAFVAYLKQHHRQSMQDICYTACTGRGHFNHSLAIVGKSKDQFLNCLERILSLNLTEDSHLESNWVYNRSLYGNPGITFVYGDPADYGKILNAGDIMDLYGQPVFKETIDRCDRILERYGKSFLKRLLTSPDRDISGDGLKSRVLAFSHAYAITALLDSWGVTPEAARGLGIGEHVSAAVLGDISLQGGLKRMIGGESPIGRDSSEFEAWFEGKGNDGDEIYLNIGLPDKLLASVRKRNNFIPIKFPVGDGLLMAVLQLYTLGIEIDWEKFYASVKPHKVELPLYPFEKKRYWVPGIEQPKVTLKDTIFSAKGIHAPAPVQPFFEESVSNSEDFPKNVFVPESQRIKEQDGNGRKPLQSLSESRFERIPKEVLIKHITRIFVEELIDKLEFNPEDIDPDQSLADYGLDSVFAVQMMKVYEEKAGISLDPTLLFDYGTIHELAAYLFETYRDAFEAYFYREKSIPLSDGGETEESGEQTAQQYPQHGWQNEHVEQELKKHAGRLSFKGRKIKS